MRSQPCSAATPVAIYADNVNDVVAGGYQSYADVCGGIEDLCAKYGVVEPAGSSAPAGSDAPVSTEVAAATDAS